MTSGRAQSASAPRAKLYQLALHALGPLRERITSIRDGQEFLQGISVFVTPGHTIFKIASDGQFLTYIADIGRHHILNVKTSRLKFLGDTDPAAGVASCIRMIDVLPTTGRGSSSPTIPGPTSAPGEAGRPLPLLPQGDGNRRLGGTQRWCGWT